MLIIRRAGDTRGPSVVDTFCEWRQYANGATGLGVDLQQRGRYAQATRSQYSGKECEATQPQENVALLLAECFARSQSCAWSSCQQSAHGGRTTALWLDLDPNASHGDIPNQTL